MVMTYNAKHGSDGGNAFLGKLGRTNSSYSSYDDTLKGNRVNLCFVTATVQQATTARHLLDTTSSSNHIW